MRNVNIFLNGEHMEATESRIIPSNISEYPRIMVFQIDPLSADQSKVFIEHIEFTEDYQNINYNNNCLMYIRTVTFVDNELSYGYPYHRYISGSDGRNYHLCSLYIPPGTYNDVDEIVEALNVSIEESINSLFNISITTIPAYDSSSVEETNLVSPAGVLNLKDGSLDSVTLTNPPWTDKVYYRIVKIDYSTANGITIIKEGDLIAFDNLIDITTLMEAQIEAVTFYKNKYTNYVSTVVDGDKTNTVVGIVDTRILSPGLQSNTIYPNKLKSFKLYGVRTKADILSITEYVTYNENGDIIDDSDEKYSSDKSFAEGKDIPYRTYFVEHPAVDITFNYLYVEPVMSYKWLTEMNNIVNSSQNLGMHPVTYNYIELTLKFEIVTLQVVDSAGVERSLRVTGGNITVYGLRPYYDDATKDAATTIKDCPIIYRGRVITDNNILDTNAMGIVMWQNSGGFAMQDAPTLAGEYTFIFSRKNTILWNNERVDDMKEYNNYVKNNTDVIYLDNYVNDIISSSTPDTYTFGFLPNEITGEGSGYPTVIWTCNKYDGASYKQIYMTNRQASNEDRHGDKFTKMFLINTLMENITVSNANINTAEMYTDGNLAALTNIYSGNEADYIARTPTSNFELFHDAGLYMMYKTLVANKKIFTYTDSGIECCIPIIPVEYLVKMSRTESFIDEYKPDNYLTKIMPTILEKYGGSVSTTTNLEKLSTFYEENDSVNNFYGIFMTDGCLWKCMGVIPLQVLTNTIKLNRSGNIDVQDNEFETPVWLIKGTMYTEEFYNGSIKTQKKYNVRYSNDTTNYNIVIGMGIDVSANNNATLFESTRHQRDYIADLALPDKISAYISVTNDIESILNNNSLEFFENRSKYTSNTAGGLTANGRIDINTTVNILNNSFYVYVVAPGSRYPLRNINGRLYINRI